MKKMGFSSLYRKPARKFTLQSKDILRLTNRKKEERCCWLGWNGSFSLIYPFLSSLVINRNWVRIEINFSFLFSWSKSYDIRETSWVVIFAIFNNIIIKFIMFKQDVLFEIHSFIDLKSLANNAKIRSSLKFLLIQYSR